MISPPPNRRPRSVAEHAPHEVPWTWKALALTSFLFLGVLVASESAVTHRQSFQTTAGTAKIDVNFSTQEELESLPGIGPVLAKAVMAGRPFRTIEELRRIRGIGPALMKKLTPLVKAAQGRRTADNR
ncbi:MAG: ComEA family DNA-binding protein [Prosthecobacter sp.]